MSADPVEISARLSFGLYRLYLACRKARRDGRRLPGQVGAAVDELAAIYRDEGCTDEGIPKAGPLIERFAAEDRRADAKRYLTGGAPPAEEIDVAAALERLAAPAETFRPTARKVIHSARPPPVDNCPLNAAF